MMKNFKKCVYVLLMAGFVGSSLCFVGCDEKKPVLPKYPLVKAQKKYDPLSTKQGMWMYLIQAAEQGNTEGVWSCIDPGARELLQKAANQSGLSVSNAKVAMCNFMRDYFNSIRRSDGTVYINDIKELNCIMVNGKYYCNMSEALQKVFLENNNQEEEESYE